MRVPRWSSIKYRARYSAYTFWEANRTAWRNNKVKFSQVTYCMAANAGDTTLSQCVRRTFESSPIPRGVMWNLIPVTGTVTQKTIDRINCTDALIIGGGGLFLPDTNRNDISGWQWAVPEQLLEKITCPVIVYSVGYNLFKGQTNSPLFVSNLRALCEKAAFIGLRNHGSVRAVRDLLPENLREKVIYQPCTTTVIRKLYGPTMKQKNVSNRIAVNMAFDRPESRYGGKKDIILNGVARFCKLLMEKGFQIVSVYHLHADAEFSAYLDNWDVRYSECDLTNALPAKVIQFYNNIDMVIGMRGHAQMIPFGVNCEIISLGTHDKMKWFLEDIHAQDWYVDLNRTDVDLIEELWSVFRGIHIENRSQTKKRLLNGQEQLWRITKENMNRINEILPLPIEKR